MLRAVGLWVGSAWRCKPSAGRHRAGFAAQILLAERAPTASLPSGARPADGLPTAYRRPADGLPNTRRRFRRRREVGPERLRHRLRLRPHHVERVALVELAVLHHVADRCWCCGCSRAGCDRGRSGPPACRPRASRRPAAGRSPRRRRASRLAASRAASGRPTRGSTSPSARPVPAAGRGCRAPARPPAWTMSATCLPILAWPYSSGRNHCGRRRIIVSSSSYGTHLPQLRVAVGVLALEAEVLAPRRAVGDEDRRRVEGLGPRHELDHVLVERQDRQAVLLAGVAVGHLREIQLQIERALDRGRDAVFLARLRSSTAARSGRRPRTA